MSKLDSLEGVIKHTLEQVDGDDKVKFTQRFAVAIDSLKESEEVIAHVLVKFMSWIMLERDKFFGQCMCEKLLSFLEEQKK